MIDVSIILPSYNSINYIEKAIKSVIDQTFKNWELIIIDDCSKDGTKLLLKKKYSKIKKIKIIFNKKNLGPGLSRNKGLKFSKGKYVAFLDSDDVWKKNKIKIQLHTMKKKKYFFSFTQVLYKKEKYLKKRLFKLPKKVNYSSLIYHNIITTSSVMIDNTFLKGNNLSFNKYGYDDYSLWLKILQRTKYSYLIDKYLTIYNTNYNLVSRNKLLALEWIWRIYFIENKLNFFKSLTCCFVNIILSVSKKIFYVKT